MFNSIDRLLSLVVILVLSFPPSASAQSAQKLKDFRGTSQTIVLLGAFSEFVDPELKSKLLSQMRKVINRYSRSFGESSISGFKLALNPNDQYLRPITGAFNEAQKQFLKSASKDNSVDIIILAALTETGEGLDLEAQLFDVRIETLSGVEKVVFLRGQENRALEDLTYRLMNYLDRDGFVHPQVQDVLEKPLSLQNSMGAMNSSSAGAEEFSVNPEELSGAGILAGKPVIGGEETPFWESWWFWTILGGTFVSAGALTYYFTVVDEPPTQANIQFRVGQ